jgi:ribosomal protein S6--L-glutamate ligase
MRFCFIIEEQYRNKPMPMLVVDQLLQWGHDIDLLEPQTTITYLSSLADQGYDAYVLKSLAEGPGLSILAAAEAIGIPTINSSRSVRLVRDKAVAATFARAHGLPIPDTYFVAHPRLLQQLPESIYPLVVKPSNGSSCRGIYYLHNPADLATLHISEEHASFLLAQRYAENTDFDMKVYVIGKEVCAAVAKKSPLHENIEEHVIPLTPQIRKLALQVGAFFGLDIYGVDMVETPQGLTILDINDFPSFARVPFAAPRIAQYVLHTAKSAAIQYEKHNQLLRATLDSSSSLADEQLTARRHNGR